MGHEQNIQTAVLAFQLRQITAAQLAEVCHALGADADRSATDVLIARGLISDQERSDLERLINSAEDDAVSKSRDGGGGAAMNSTVDLFERTVIPESDSPRDNPDDREAAGKQDSEPRGGESASDGPLVEESPQGQFERTVISRSAPNADQKPGEKSDEEPPRVTLLDTISAPDGTRQMSRYTLTRVHGEGGLGRVWLARDAALNREVALKEIRDDKKVSKDTSLRFLREAQITGQLEHPNIIPVYDLSQADESDQPYYTMRLLRGRTLTHELRSYHKSRKAGEENPLDFPRLLDAFVSICNAIHFANSKGVIHRDLKPDNVMIGAFGEVIVLDWGLALLVEEARDTEFDAPAVTATIDDLEKTQAGGIMGTPAYMAPEQAAGNADQIGIRTDVYGLGAILYTILVGRGPHKRDVSETTIRDTMDLLKFITVRDAPRPRDIDPTIPQPLDAICRKALERRPSKRYANAKELADDVRRYLADEPVSCITEPWRERSLRWLRKHKTWAQALATALVFIAFFAVVAAVFINGARQREEKARIAAEAAHEGEQLAHAESVRAKAEAVRRFQQTRRTSDRALEGVSDVLLNFPGMQRIRLELLRQLAADYQSYADEDSADPALQLEAGRALLRLGTIHKRMGQYDDAIEAYQDGLERFTKLLSDDSGNTEVRLELAEAHNLLGVLFGILNRVDEAEDSYASALSELQDMHSQAAEDAELRSRLSGVRANFANLQHQTGKSEEAVETLKEVGAEFESLCQTRSDPSDAMNLARSRTSLAQLYSALGRSQEAEEAATSAVSEWNDLTIRDPDEPEYQLGLIDSQITLANALQLHGRRREQAHVYQQAIESSEVLVASQPDIPAFQEKLALSRHNYANLLHQIGENAQAEELSKLALSTFIELVNASTELNPLHYAEQGAASMLLGRIMRDRGDDGVAEQGFVGAIEIFLLLTEQVPTSSEFRRRLGTARRTYAGLLSRSGKTEEAIGFLKSAEVDLKAVLSVAPQDQYAANGLALVYEDLAVHLSDQGNAGAAAEYYRSAIEVRLDLTESVEHLGSLASLLANCRDPEQRDTEKAVSIAQTAVMLAPECDRARNILAMAQLRNNQLDECLMTIADAEPIRFRKNDTLDFLRSLAFAEKNDQESAQAALTVAVERMNANAPGNPALLEMLAEVQAKLQPPPESSAE